MMFLKKLIRLKDNKVLTGSFELLLVIVSVFVVSYAWFVKTTKNNTDNLFIKTKASRMLYISLDDGKTWNTELSLNLDKMFKFNNAVTSDGVNFSKAATKRDDGTPITFKKAEAGKDYLEFDMLFKSSAPLGVFLNRDSSVIPSCGVTSDKLLGDLAVRKSSYGDFSRDLIAGSLRVSFTVNDYVENSYISQKNSSLVWAPNKEYELKYNNGLYDFDIKSKTPQDYRYIDSSQGYEYKNLINFKDNIRADFDIDNAYGDPMIVKIDPTFNDGIKSVTVRVWVEGNDRETHDALTGGMFKLNLNFMGIVKSINPSILNVFKHNNKLMGFIEGMEYSKDFGNTWITYNDKLDLTFNPGDVVYVRYFETENFYASDKKIVNF